MSKRFARVPLPGGDAAQTVHEGGAGEAQVDGNLVALAVEEDYRGRQDDGYPLLERHDGVDALYRNLVKGRFGTYRREDKILGIRINIHVVVLGGVLEEQNQIEHVDALGRFVVTLV